MSQPEVDMTRDGSPVPPLSDYLGTHQCSKNVKLGGF